MSSKESKRMVKKQASATVVLAATMVFFMISMFFVSKDIGTSYAIPTDSVPKTLKWSGEKFAPNNGWKFISKIEDGGETLPVLALLYDFKATNEANSKQYDLYCIEGQNAQIAEGYYDLDDEIPSLVAPGLAYILRNSYPMNESSTYMAVCDKATGVVNGSPDAAGGQYKRECRKYITQYAIWYYLDIEGYRDREGRAQLADGAVKKILDAKSTNIVADAISRLVEDASNYNDKQTQAADISINKNNIQYTISEDGKFLESNEIVVNSNKKIDNYSVGFDSNNCDATIVDINGNETSIFGSGTNFKIRIPVEKINSLETIDMVVAVTASYTTDTVYSYKNRNDANSQKPIIAAYTDGVAPVDVTLETKLAKIIKTDKETGKVVSGAVLAILTKDGTEMTRFTTSENPYYINLAPGEYFIKEITAPEGYELSDEAIPFTVTENNTINKVEIKNTPTTKVPDTASNIPAYLYIIGSMILVIGVAVIVVTTRQSKSN